MKFPKYEKKKHKQIMQKTFHCQKNNTRHAAVSYLAKLYGINGDIIKCITET